MTKKSVVSLVLLLLLLATYEYVAGGGNASVDQTEAGTNDLIRLMDSQASGTMVNSAGVVSRILSDDTEGSRHQRFIVRVVSDKTVLISHNIDLAQRVPLSLGDSVAFRGQYEWNDQGGVVHWTHHDPAGKHSEGWIEHEGVRYE